MTREMRGDGTVYRQKGSRFLWLQYYVNGQRVRESSGTDNEKSAWKLLRQKSVAVENGEGNSSGKLTLSELYLAIERDYIINSRKDLPSLKSRWNNHLKEVFGEKRISAVTPEVISLYVAQRKSGEDPASNATVNRELAILKRMYKLAIKGGRMKLGQQPYIEMLKERNVRKGFVRDEQYAALARETAKVGLWLRTMFELGFTYGWRASELTEMRVEQVDLMKRAIYLNPGETKNDEGRVVSMTEKIFELLTACVRDKQASGFLLTREVDRQGRKPRKTASPDVGRIWSYDEAWGSATEAAGCSGLLFHDLRRTAVRNMIDAGIPEKVAMMISGHKTRSIFDRYHIVDIRKLEEAAKRMDQASRERKTRELLLSQQDISFAIEAPELAAKTLSEERHSLDIAANQSKPN